MKLAVLFVGAVGLVLLVGIYKLFAGAPNSAQDSDSRFGPGPGDGAGGGD